MILEREYREYLANLPQAERIMFEDIEQIVEKRCMNAQLEPAHDLLHMGRVTVNTLKLSMGDGLDPKLPVLTGLLHDIGRPEEVILNAQGYTVNHTNVSGMLTPLVLEKYLGIITEQELLTVQDAVQKHSSLNDLSDSEVTIAIKDADRLDAFGPIGICRVLSFLPGHTLYNPKAPFAAYNLRMRDMLKTETPVLDAFSYNFEWVPWLRSNTAIKMAQLRIFEQLRFLYNLAPVIGHSPEEVEQNPVIIAARDFLDLPKNIDHYLTKI